MLDDFRRSAEEVIEEEQPAPLPTPRKPAEPFLGMTASQRFVLALMIFLMVCVLGFVFLFATDSIYLPFF
jgi:hypothetical protein